MINYHLSIYQYKNYIKEFSLKTQKFKMYNDA